RAITGSLCEPTIVLRQQRFTLRLYLLHGVTGCFMEYHAWRERSGKGMYTFVSFFIGVIGLAELSIIRSFEPMPTGVTQICCTGIVKGV
ncbi:hypothetical protein NP493_41g05017, partial [Ridgeia piscesae]